MNILKRTFKNTYMTRYFVQKQDNLYKVLNLTETCTVEEVKDNFITLAKKYDPEKSSCDSSSEKFQKVFYAYTILSTPATRRGYDLKLNPKIAYQRPTDYLYKRYHEPWKSPSEHYNNVDVEYNISHWRNIYDKQQTIELFKKLKAKKKTSLLKKIPETAKDIGFGLIFCFVLQAMGGMYAAIQMSDIFK